MQHFYIFNRLQNISIHALREEGDCQGMLFRLSL